MTRFFLRNASLCRTSTVLGRDAQDLHQEHREAVLADALESGPIEVMIERVSYCALEDRMSCYRRPSVRRRVSLTIETMKISIPYTLAFQYSQAYLSKLGRSNPARCDYPNSVGEAGPLAGSFMTCAMG